MKENDPKYFLQTLNCATSARSREPLALLPAGALVPAWSGVAPKDRAVWLMEVPPAIAGAVALGLTFRRFPFTPLVYRLIFVFSLVLMVGGKYTYAEVPLGFRVRDALLSGGTTSTGWATSSRA